MEEILLLYFAVTFRWGNAPHTFGGKLVLFDISSAALAERLRAPLW